MSQLFFPRHRCWVNARVAAAELHAELEVNLPHVPVGVPQSAKSMEVMVALTLTQKRLISP